MSEVGLEWWLSSQNACYGSKRTWVQVSGTHSNKPGVMLCACIPSTGKVETGGPLGLAGQSLQLVCKLQVQWETVSKNKTTPQAKQQQQNKVESNRENYQMLTSGLHAHKYIGPR